MNPNEMSEADKKRFAGQCNFTMLFLFCTAAWICGLYSTGYCAFVGRDITLVDGVSPDDACSLVNMTQSVCDTFLGNHGVGFWAWQGTVPVDQTVCFSYTVYVPLVGYVTPDFDTKFNSAKAFSVLADIFGAFAWFTFAFSLCCPLSQGRLKGLSCYFFFATLFQGLTFLIFKSNVCAKGFFQQYFVAVDNFDDVVKDVSCSLKTGSNLAVAATVLYFFCMCLVPAAVAPGPIGYEGEEGYDAGVDAEQGGAANTTTAAAATDAVPKSEDEA